ncbi:uncharacterized protein AAG666_001655 [Megaptera novaeangliae]
MEAFSVHSRRERLYLLKDITGKCLQTDPSLYISGSQIDCLTSILTTAHRQEHLCGSIEMQQRSSSKPLEKKKLKNTDIEEAVLSLEGFPPQPRKGKLPLSVGKSWAIPMGKPLIFVFQS